MDAREIENAHVGKRTLLPTDVPAPHGGAPIDPVSELMYGFVYKCRPCEYVSPFCEERADAKEHATWHRHSWEHFWRFAHIEGVEPVTVERSEEEVRG